MNQNTREKLLVLPIEEKIEYSKSIIKKAIERFSTEHLYVAWTGGKDSTTMLWLYRRTCQELKISLPKAMFIDEGHVFDEIFELVEGVKNEWNLDVIVAKNTDVSDKASGVGDLIRVSDLNKRNRQEIENLEYSEDTFPFEPESFIGNHLMKTVAMNVFLDENGAKALSTGIRWDEQDARVEENFFSPRSVPAHTRIHPILHFKERDIWDTIHKFDIPFCSLYYKGYRSLGAKGSTFRNSDIPAWEQDLENTPERGGRGQDKEKIMTQLRSLGYM